MKEKRLQFRQIRFGCRFCKSAASFSYFLNLIRSTLISTPTHKLLPTCLLILTNCFYTSGQTNTPQSPEVETFKPIQVNPNTNNSLNQQSFPSSTPGYPAGETRRGIIKQWNQNEMNQGGVPAPVVPLSDTYIAHQFILNQYNQNIYPTKNFQQHEKLLSVMNEMNNLNKGVRKSRHYESPEYKTDLANYQNAFDKLKNMLEKKIPLSLADAFYTEESAYGNLQMSYKEYKNTIAECAAFIKQWMIENRLNTKNSEAVHLAIQKFMGDTLTIKNNKGDNMGGISVSNAHQPFMYDYIDYRAEKDLHNYFLTKTLTTGTGQCNTLPRVYLVLAEALGVNASLSFAPQHSFIKYQNNKGTIENYEPTIDWHMSDNDYTEEMPVLSSAIYNKIYLNPLNKKQTVASIIIDLAYNFEREHWIADGKFMNKCIDYAMNYFHNKEGHSEGLLLKNLLLASQLDSILQKNNISDLNEINKSPEAMQAYEAFQRSENRIKQLGIQQFPEVKYNAMLEKHDGRGKLQIAKGMDTKSKKSLFFNLQIK